VFKLEIKLEMCCVLIEASRMLAISRSRKQDGVIKIVRRWENLIHISGTTGQTS